MRDLLQIIEEKKETLSKPSLKLVNKFYNKIKGGSYFVDDKNIVKLRELATPEVCTFLLECIQNYDETTRDYRGHHDVISLRSVWALLAFSREKDVLDYFHNLISGESSNKRFYLHYLLSYFRHELVKHPYADMLIDFYENLSKELTSYKLMEVLDITPPDKFGWSVMINLINFGEWYTTNGLTKEEMEKQYTLSIFFGSPGTLHSTFYIEIQNSLSEKRQKIRFEEFSDSGVFTINVNEKAFQMPDLCKLDLFLKEAESYFGTIFQTDKPAYLSVSKGISRKRIEKWVKNRLVISD
ncbi:MAG: hypothetical protein Q4A72_05600 [Bacillota bacterium]|nr:hypothetical protein [Bacillota bacterium]